MVEAIQVRGAGALPWWQWGVGEEPPATWRATGRQISIHWLGGGLGSGSAGEACIRDDA